MFEKDVEKYCPKGYAVETFFSGRLISVPSNCGFYVRDQANRNADIILGIIFASEMQSEVIALRGLDAMQRGYEVARRNGQETYVRLIAVESILERPWSEGAKVVVPPLTKMLEEECVTHARRNYKGLITGYGGVDLGTHYQDFVSLALVLTQVNRSFHSMVDLYFDMVKRCAKKSLEQDRMFLPANYECNLTEVRRIIEGREMLPQFEGEAEQRMVGYSERLQLAGIVSLTEFRSATPLLTEEARERLQRERA